MKDYNRHGYAPNPKPSFQCRCWLREQAIIDAVNRLLADKGFDAMTVDEVAGAVGIAKASLYANFPSKGRPGRRRHGAPDAGRANHARRCGRRPAPAGQAARGGGMDHAPLLSGHMPTLPARTPRCAPR